MDLHELLTVLPNDVNMIIYAKHASRESQVMAGTLETVFGINYRTTDIPERISILDSLLDHNATVKWIRPALIDDTCVIEILLNDPGITWTIDLSSTIGVISAKADDKDLEDLILWYDCISPRKAFQKATEHILQSVKEPYTVTYDRKDHDPAQWKAHIYNRDGVWVDTVALHELFWD